MLIGRIVFKGQNRTIRLLFIRLKKAYMNPHENGCSKVISILITGNILHESSSAPQQHKSVQYKRFSFYLHRDLSHTDMLQPHFISCRGVSGAGGNMRRSSNFCQFYVVLSLFYSLQRGSNGFIAEKTILILYQGSRGVYYIPGGGGGRCPTFSRGEWVLRLRPLSKIDYRSLNEGESLPRSNARQKTKPVLLEEIYFVERIIGRKETGQSVNNCKPSCAKVWQYYCWLLPGISNTQRLS